ncbi:MAG: hypothetical protein JXB36_03895 [Gammaproteobacteria bacterium]|nr:hypothetical protein [Gammaproteobacteria bacterium]
MSHHLVGTAMPRPIATSTGLSIAAHAVAITALVGVRFETAERASFGVVEVEWFVLDDRIDAGTSSGTAGAAVLAEAPVEEMIPGSEATERRPVQPAAGPTAPGAIAPPAARPPPDAPDRRSAPTATSSPARPARSLSPVQPPPEPAQSPPPVQLTVPRPADAGATAPAALAAFRPDAAAAAPQVEVPLPDVPPPALRDPAAAAASLPSAPPPARRDDTPPRDDPLVAEVEALAVEAAALEEPATLRFEHDGDEYTVTFTPAPAADDMSLDRMIVAVSTEREGEKRSTEMRFKRIAFSNFAQFVDRWDPAVHIHDDEIDGRFHSNSEIYVDTGRGIRPTFHGRVTTSRGVSTSSGRSGSFRFRRSDVFLGGLETRIPRIALPSELAPFRAIRDGANVHRFASGARITFHADGTYTSAPLDGSAPAERRALAADTAYLIAGEDAALHVRGVVDGRVLVHSPERIVVEGDLVYAADPASPGADDYLGLVSDGNVEVAEPEVTGPGDLQIHAAIYAKRRFAVRRYRARELATLSIVGSVTAGSLTASEPRYRTRVRFDRRLEDARPPGFPTTDRYELASWDRQWTGEAPRQSIGAEPRQTRSR